MAARTFVHSYVSVCNTGHLYMDRKRYYFCYKKHTNKNINVVTVWNIENVAGSTCKNSPDYVVLPAYVKTTCF